MDIDSKFYFNVKEDIAPLEREFIPITGLAPIDREQLIFSGELEDDRVCTDLSLCDYDWAHYCLSTRFNTKENGIIRVQWDYNLFAFAEMMVTQIKDYAVTYYYIEFDSSIFGKYLKKYLEEHTQQWTPNAYAFNGEEIVVDLFNEVIEKGNLCGRALSDKSVPHNLSWSVNSSEDADIRTIIKELNGNGDI